MHKHMPRGRFGCARVRTCQLAGLRRSAFAARQLSSSPSQTITRLQLWPIDVCFKCIGRVERRWNATTKRDNIIPTAIPRADLVAG